MGFSRPGMDFSRHSAIFSCAESFSPVDGGLSPTPEGFFPVRDMVGGSAGVEGYSVGEAFVCVYALDHPLSGGYQQ